VSSSGVESGGAPWSENSYDVRPTDVRCSLKFVTRWQNIFFCLFTITVSVVPVVTVVAADAARMAEGCRGLGAAASAEQDKGA